MRLKKRDARGRLVKTPVHRYDYYVNEDDNPDIVEYLDGLTKRNRLQKEFEVMIRNWMARKGRPDPAPVEESEESEDYADEPDQDILDDFGAPI